MKDGDGVGWWAWRGLPVGRRRGEYLAQFLGGAFHGGILLYLLYSLNNTRRCTGQ